MSTSTCELFKIFKMWQVVQKKESIEEVKIDY